MCSPSIHQPAKNNADVLDLDKKMVLHVEGLLCSPGRGSVAGCRGRNRRQTASTAATGVLLSSTRSKTRGSAGLRQAGGVDNGDSERTGEKSNLLYEGFLKLGAPLTVVLVCFVQGVDRYI